MTKGADELSAQARAVLAIAREADDPSAEDRARIDASFGATLAGLGIVGSPVGDLAPNTSAVPAAATAKSGTSALVAKLALAASVAVASFVYYYYAPQRPTSHAHPATTIAAAASLGSDKAAIAQASPPRNAAAESPASDAPASEPSAGRPLGLASHAGGRPLLGRRNPTLATSTSSLPAEDALRDEVGLLEAANGALRSERYERAMSLLDAHAARFPDGALREERLGLRVLALCGLGETKRGLREREHFLKSSPHSVLVERVRAACELAHNQSSKAHKP